MGFTVHPRRPQHFGAPAGAFILITNTAYAGHVRLVPDGSYASYLVLSRPVRRPMRIRGAARPDGRLLLDGEIALQGYPIVHAGEATRARRTQAHFYKALEVLRQHAMIATVHAGAITQLRTAEPQAESVVALCQEIFARHPHYRTIAEIGLSFNDAFEPLPGNHAANQVWGGRYGAVHIGIGPQPFTHYHVTLVCPGLRLMGKDRHVLVGPPSGTQVELHHNGLSKRLAG